MNGEKRWDAMDLTACDRLARALARRISDPGLAYDAVLVDLSALFGGDDPRELYHQLDDAARPIFVGSGADLRARASLLGDVLFDHLGLRVERTDHRALLLGHALSERRADPLLLAVLGHELARRAGWSSVVAHGAGEHWTVLEGEDRYLPIGYTRPRDQSGPTTLDNRCPHEVSYSALAAITQRGPAGPARIALRVRALLPLCPHGDREEDGE